MCACVSVRACMCVYTSAIEDGDGKIYLHMYTDVNDSMQYILTRNQFCYKGEMKLSVKSCPLAQPSAVCDIP